MVSIRQSHTYENLTLGSDAWLALLDLEPEQQQALKACMTWCESFELCTDELRDFGCDMVEILSDLRMDFDSYIAGFLYLFYRNAVITEADILDRHGEPIMRLLKSTEQMETMHLLQSEGAHDQGQVDKVRRLLMAMVDDVRAVVIKLSERICHLRSIKNAEEEMRVLAAKETSNIYAPLANRLGIGQLKWELEDLAFRYLHPQEYKRIAKQLEEKRSDRETYMQEFVDAIHEKLGEFGLQCQVDGRPKHIYSIWRKMRKKDYDFEHLFDIRAVRIITDKLPDCYAALGAIHTNWYHLHNEFADYVATPKPNGYQSLHTVVIGPEGKAVEVQIRTEQMHKDAELGVAAHWRYKQADGSTRDSGYENKMDWLRKLLQWQEDISDEVDLGAELRNQVIEERVYVFTPKGEIVDLPSGSTPLDFAYYIHSNVGHRCIGAKVGGRIVQFTYALKTGDQIEILTQKQPNPSRDWLNPNLGFVKSSRARSKIATWFKQQDKEKNAIAGKEQLESELSKLALTLKDTDCAVERFNMKTLDDLLAAIGAGDVRINQVVNFLQSQFIHEEVDEIDPRLKQKSAPSPSSSSSSNVIVQGVGNLLTHMAKCCNPVPGDAIHGFITQGKGVAIHRDDCAQFLRMSQQSPERLIDAEWAEKTSGGYSLGISVLASDRTGLLRDITSVLANEKVNVLGMQTKSDIKEQTAVFDIDIEIFNTDNLNSVLSKLSQVSHVINAKRAVR